MSTLTPTVGQAVLSMIESDLATVGGEPLITLLTSLKANAGNVLMQQASILAFVATAPGAGLQLGIEVEQQLIGLAITKLQAQVTKAATQAV